MQNEEVSPDPQSKVCWKNMGQKQVYVSPKKKKENEKAYFPSAPFTETAVLPWGVTDDTKASL